MILDGINHRRPELSEITAVLKIRSVVFYVWLGGIFDNEQNLSKVKSNVYWITSNTYLPHIFWYLSDTQTGFAIVQC